MTGQPTIERFMAKVSEADGGCWEWTAYRSNGYGRFWTEDRLVLAHRWSYEFHRGPVPEGLVLDHLCRNRACVNPWHLEPVTAGENIRRGSVGFDATGMCRSGRHAINSRADLHVRASGVRACRACSNEASLETQSLVSQASRALGISRDAYRERYGQSRTVARDTLFAAVAS